MLNISFLNVKNLTQNEQHKQINLLSKNNIHIIFIKNLYDFNIGLCGIFIYKYLLIYLKESSILYKILLFIIFLEGKIFGITNTNLKENLQKYSKRHGYVYSLEASIGNNICFFDPGLLVLSKKNIKYNFEIDLNIPIYNSIPILYTNMMYNSKCLILFIDNYIFHFYNLSDISEITNLQISRFNYIYKKLKNTESIINLDHITIQKKIDQLLIMKKKYNIDSKINYLDLLDNYQLINFDVKTILISNFDWNNLNLNNVNKYFYNIKWT